MESSFYNKKTFRSLMTGRFLFVPQSGFEPETDGLENRCSIQLSYWGPCKIDAKIAKLA